MAVTFNKPHGLKYTDMAIYIDAHMPEILVPNEKPDIESKIYEYLYHIVYALACKAGYFKNFADYDSYALYAATELYFSLRKKLLNAGKEVRGKVIIPVKSSLNFIKSTLFPLKINYQREAFAEVLDPKIHDNVDKLQNDMRESIQDQYRPSFEYSYAEAIKQFPKVVKVCLMKLPFKKDTIIFKNIYISVLLTLVNTITVPNKIKNKINSKRTLENRKKSEKKIFLAYKKVNDKPILWHLDERYSDYIKVLAINIRKQLTENLHIYIHGDDLSDDLVSHIIASAYAQTDDLGEDN